MALKPIAIVVGYGQSNEKGTGVAPRYTGSLSATDPNGYVRAGYARATASIVSAATAVGTPGNWPAASMFDRLADIIAMRTGRGVVIDNRAVGGTGVVVQWAGESGGVPLRPWQGGYDPSARVAGVVASVASYVAAGYEVWQITAGHQADLAAGKSVSNIVTAASDIALACVAAGASRVLVGKTPRYLGGPTESAWDAGGSIHQIADGIVSAVGAPAVIGGDLSSMADLSHFVADGTVGTASDSQAHVHLNHAGVCRAANIWRAALVAAGLI